MKIRKTLLNLTRNPKPTLVVHVPSTVYQLEALDNNGTQTVRLRFTNYTTASTTYTKLKEALPATFTVTLYQYS